MTESVFKKLHEFTDGNKTGQVFFTNIGKHRFMALLYQADLDYNDAKYFETEQDAEDCAENWVLKK
jgi:predicted component of type VI protein secretion system